MQDGHTGTDRSQRARDKTRDFELALTYLVEGTRRYFVIHIDPRTFTLSGLQPGEFLTMLGFSRYPGQCPELGGECYYLYAFEAGGRFDHDAARYARREYDKFVAELDRWYRQARELMRHVGKLSSLFPWAERFSHEPKLLDLSGEEPGWLDEYKVAEHKKLQGQREKLDEKLKQLDTITYCLWGKDPPLEESVHTLLEDLGLEVEKTVKGAPIDRMATLPGSGLRFALQITGTEDKIRQASNKMSQAVLFDQERQQRQGNEKGILVANTYCDRPAADRSNLEHFTPQATSILKTANFVAMTTVDLYNIWKSCKYEANLTRDIFEKIYNHSGGVFEFSNG